MFLVLHNIGMLVHHVSLKGPRVNVTFKVSYLSKVMFTTLLSTIFRRKAHLLAQKKNLRKKRKGKKTASC